jgi:cobalt/nickel transport system permease protein
MNQTNANLSPNFFCKLDPRVKIFLFVAFSLAVAVTPVPRERRFAAYFLFLLAVAALSRQSLARSIKQIALLFPFLLGLGLTIFLFGRETPAQKINLFLALGTKTFLILLALQLFLLRTEFYRLLKALESLRVPSLAVAIVSFAHRYLLLFREEIGRLMKAKESRTFGRKKLHQEITIVSHLVPAITTRSLERSERIYAAMLSRGYDGKTIRTLDVLKLQKEDILVGCLAIFFLAVITIVL